MIYALIVAYGSPRDFYFQDAISYPDMVACEKDKTVEVEYIKRIHPWVTFVKGVCVPEHARGVESTEHQVQLEDDNKPAT